MKTSGICFVCGRECFVVLDYNIIGPQQGEPYKLGAAHDDTMRVTMVAVDGSLMQVSAHRDCVEGIDVAKLWAQVMERLAFEHRHRKAMGAQALTASQEAQFKTHSLKFYDNRPLGILAVERWQDVGTG